MQALECIVNRQIAEDSWFMVQGNVFAGLG